MDVVQLKLWIEQNQLLALMGLFLLSMVGFFVVRFLIARSLIYLAKRTETQYDDIVVRHLRPFRAAWLAPVIVIYIFADLFPAYQSVIEVLSLFLILWIAIITFNAILSAVNDIYESSPNFSGVSIQGYLDIVKIFAIILGVIFSISLFTGKSPLVLLTGVGALMAVLLLIFRDTILSIVASVQISTYDLVKEGDWIEVPSYGADGDVLNLSLHTIKVQNWDKTITVIPTYKMIEVGYKNWRGMQESGGRRIKRSISIDMASIRFCDQAMLKEFRKIDLISLYLENRLQEMDQFLLEHADSIDSPLDGPQITNVEIFRAYIAAYLKSRDDIHQEGMTFLIRSLAPGRSGLPIEVYAFTKTTDWLIYEKIQAEIFDHLLAVAPIFGLRVFQEPTGMDFAAMRSGS
jgi:miniconductance mechanosensitive channel